MQGKEFTSIRLTTKTRDRLKTRGMKGEDYDSIIIKLLDATEPQKAIEKQGNFEGIPAIPWTSNLVRVDVQYK